MITFKKKCPRCEKIHEVHCLLMSPFGVTMCSESYFRYVEAVNKCPKCGYKEIEK